MLELPGNANRAPIEIDSSSYGNVSLLQPSGSKTGSSIVRFDEFSFQAGQSARLFTAQGLFFRTEEA